MAPKPATPESSSASNASTATESPSPGSQACSLLTQIQSRIKRLLDLSSTPQKVALGGNAAALKPDLAAAIKLLELLIKTADLETRSLQRTFRELDHAPIHVQEAWQTLTRYFADPSSYLHRSRR